MAKQSKSPKSKSNVTKKTNPFVSLLLFLALVAPIALVVVLLEVVSDADNISWGFVADAVNDGASAGVFFMIVGFVPVLWSLMMFVAQVFMQPKDRKGLRFLAFCMLATGIGLILSGVFVSALAYGLVQIAPDLKSLWLIVSLVVGFFLIVKAGPTVAKILFVRDKAGRSIIDNSYLFGGMNMPSKKKIRKRGF